MVDAEIPSHLGFGLARPEHQIHGARFELRRKLPPFPLLHEHPLLASLGVHQIGSSSNIVAPPFPRGNEPGAIRSPNRNERNERNNSCPEQLLVCGPGHIWRINRVVGTPHFAIDGEGPGWVCGPGHTWRINRGGRTPRFAIDGEGLGWVCGPGTTPWSSPEAQIL